MKKRGKLIGLLLMLVFLFAVPVTTNAATKVTYTLKNVSKPSSIKKGGYYILKGTITCNVTMKQVQVAVYDSTGKTIKQKYVSSPYSKTFNIAAADAYIEFDKLAVGTYYYRVTVTPQGASKKNVINQKFNVVGSGKIKVVNPKPSSNITLSKGSSYAIGGTIQSTYKLSKVTATISNSSGKAVYSKSVQPNKTTYPLANSVLDYAMYFNYLSAGTYKFKVTATDNQGTSATLIYRTVTVKASGSNTSTNSTGGSSTNSGSYLNTNSAVTVPSGFVKRTTRPAASNKYYYNGNYNIYYKYNSLAPTGNAYYGKMYVLGNCTWYACGRAMEIVANAGGSVSKVQRIMGGDPVGIYNTNASLGVFKYGSTPKVGSLAIFNYGSSGDAHIAVVEAIINGVPYVSESGYSVSSTKPNSSKSNIIFKYQSIYNWASGRSLRGYIYLI